MLGICGVHTVDRIRTLKLHSQDRTVFRCQAYYVHTGFQGAGISISTENQLYKHNVQPRGLRGTGCSSHRDKMIYQESPERWTVPCSDKHCKEGNPRYQMAKLSVALI